MPTLQQPSTSGEVDRRLFLGGAGAVALAVGVAGSSSRAWGSPRLADDPFSLGIASGDPLPDGVVLWTRLAPEPLHPDGRGGMPPRRVPVRWEVAEDERFRRVVRRGTTLAVPERAHAVHVEVGGLRPARWYHYRFRVGRHLSRVGRTRTAAAARSDVSAMTFAFASCQSYADGHFTAYRHLAREDLDLVVHLGDYLYEYGIPATGGVRGRPLPSHFGHETLTLADYRGRYALYKTDPHLQEAHASFPFVVTWDDHEVENNWADDVPEASSQTPDPAAFRARRTAAARAFYENLPLRRSSVPSGPNVQLYRRLRFGRLAELNVLDGRQYRDDQVCGDGLRVDCQERLDPARTMLGRRQEQWLLDGLARSRATWNVVANQVFMFQADHSALAEQAFGMDTWDGYAAARQRLFSGILDRGVENVVVLTGDAHRSAASDLLLDFDDPGSRKVAGEFLGTSISSGGNGADQDALGQIWRQENPHLKFHNVQRGYVRCTLTPTQWRSDYRVLPFVTNPGSPVFTRASLVVEAGRAGVELDSEWEARGRRYDPAFPPGLKA